MKLKVDTLKLIAIFFVGFFLPWGANFIEVGGYPPAYFIISTFILAIFMFFTGISLPWAFRLFVVFLLLHLAVTIMIFGGDYLFLEQIQARSLNSGTVYSVSESNLLLIEKMVFLLFFFIVIYSVIKKKNEWLTLAASFVAGLGAVCLLKLKFIIATFPEVRFAGAYDDSNAFGVSACLAFFLAILLFNTVKKVTFRVILFSASIFFLIMILLSQSRGALVALLCASLIVLKENRRFAFKLLLITIAIALIFFCFFKVLIPSRFLTPETWVDDRGSNRLDIWWIYLSSVWNFFLTGTGFLREKDVISTGVLGYEYIPHNVFLEILIDFGVAGLFLFCFFLKKLWLKLRHFPKSSFYAPVLKTIFVSWIIGAFFISSFILRETWLVFALIATAPALYRNHEQQAKIESL